MRSLLLSVALALGTLGLIAATPSRADASWLSQALHARYDPYYYGAYSPGYSYPGYDYYTPGYVYPSYRTYAYPGYRYSGGASYYAPRSFYWSGRHGHGHWAGGYHGSHHGWHGGHRHHR